MFVEAAALTPLGHNGQVVLRHVAHEQQDVDMSCFPVTRGRAKEEMTKTKIKLKFALKMIHQEFTNLTHSLTKTPNVLMPFLTSRLPLHF